MHCYARNVTDKQQLPSDPPFTQLGVRGDGRCSLVTSPQSNAFAPGTETAFRISALADDFHNRKDASILAIKLSHEKEVGQESFIQTCYSERIQ